MKIAFVTSGYPPISPGGAGISSKLIVDGLRDNGVDVDVFALVGDDRECTKVDSNTWYLPAGDEYPIPKVLGENFSALSHLPDLDGYDIVHVYNVRHLPATILRTSTPVLATFNNHMWMCIDPVEHLRDGIPECSVRHAFRYSKTRGYSGLTQVSRVGLEYIGKTIAKRANHFTVQTEGMEEEMVACGYDQSNISVVPNLFDPKFKIDSDNKKKIIFLGRLQKSKGPDMVLKAFSSVRDSIDSEWELEIYGNGPLRSELENMIERESIKNAKVSYSCYDELPKVYSQAGLLIHASRYTEPFSRCWLEAMASGTPILCSENPSSRSVLSEIAKFYDPFDQQDLEEKLLEVLSSESERIRMAEEGRRELNKYEPLTVTQEYVNIYNSMRII